MSLAERLRDHALFVAFAPADDPELDAPPRVFAVLTSNLLRNACQYTEQGEVVVTVGVTFIEPL